MCEKIHAGGREVFKEWSNFSQIFLKVVKMVSRRLSCNEVGASYALALWPFPSARSVRGTTAALFVRSWYNDLSGAALWRGRLLARAGARPPPAHQWQSSVSRDCGRGDGAPGEAAWAGNWRGASGAPCHSRHGGH